MNYSEEFKERCKKAYPTWERLHNALEAGSEFVGRYLCDSCETGIKNDEILSASSLEELQAKALLNKEKNKLYADFLDGNCYEDKVTPDVPGLEERIAIAAGRKKPDGPPPPCPAENVRD